MSYQQMVTNEVGEPLGIETLYDDEPGHDFMDDDYLTDYDDDEPDWREETWVDGYGNSTDPPEYVGEYRRA